MASLHAARTMVRTVASGAMTTQRCLDLMQSNFLHIRAGCASFSSASFNPYTNRHRSNAEELINRFPVIEVDGPIAICVGGSGPLGHPLEYIQLNTPDGLPQRCKYCNLKFI